MFTVCIWHYVIIFSIFYYNTLLSPHVFIFSFNDSLLFTTCGQINATSLELQLKQVLFSVIDNIVGEMDSRFSEKNWEVQMATNH
jgi:hypothetical protein